MMEGNSDFLLAGMLLALALLAGRLASHWGLPRVAAYLLVGILFSPMILGDPLGFHMGKWAESFTTGALGIIAYLIGGSITLNQLKRMGKTIAAVVLGESIGAMLVVFLTLWWLLPLPTEAQTLTAALAFAVLAISTAPAATLALIHQYRTRGPLTDTLLGVVAMDDAIGIICYTLLLTLVADNSIPSGMAMILIEIGGAALLGAFSGWILSKTSGYFGESGFRLPIILAATFVVLGVAEILHLSLLLASMSLGFFTRHFSQASAQRLFGPIHPLEETIFLLFFTIAGTHFDFSLFQHHLPLILAYFFARIAGKIAGVSLGARLCSAPKLVSRWLGLGLMPQAGVAIGLALTLSHQAAFDEISPMILNIIIGATLLNELAGPLAAKFALQKAGEIRIKREKHRHEGF